jgi:hypothetical protein
LFNGTGVYDACLQDRFAPGAKSGGFISNVLLWITSLGFLVVQLILILGPKKVQLVTVSPSHIMQLNHYALLLSLSGFLW